MIDNQCNNCPIRLYNDKGYYFNGIGNAWSGNLIIIPNVDNPSYKKGNIKFSDYINIINDCLNDANYSNVSGTSEASGADNKPNIPSTGGLEQANMYYVPLIRCNECISAEITDDILRRCQTYLIEDINKYNFKHILLLGSAVERFLHTTISSVRNSIIVSKNKRIYYSTYSPLIKYINKDKYEIFKNDINRFFNSINNDDYSRYELVKL